jgi:hypothetical protein
VPPARRPDASAATAATGPIVLTELSTRVPDSTQETRSAEPVTVGIPLPPGAALHTDDLALANPETAAIAAQWTVLDRWPADDSIRWVLLDAQLSAPHTYVVQRVAEPSHTPHEDAIRLTRDGSRRVIATAGLSCTVTEGSSDLLTVEGPGSTTRRLLLNLTGSDGGALPFRLATVAEETEGPLRTTLRLEGTVGADASPILRVTARVSWFAGCRSVKVELTLLNPRRAEHPGGYWDLGDAGSVYIRDASLVVTGLAPGRLFWSEQPGAAPLELEVPSVLYQDSSGGDHWQSRTHVNRHGRVPLRFRGYELHAPGVTRRGERATPVAWLSASNAMTALTVRHFWQNFPKALSADVDRVSAALFPAQAADEHEIQGGEQKTHVVGVAFGPDAIADRPLDWIARPMLAAAAPDWYSRAEALPYVTPVDSGSDPAYEALVRGAIEGPESFERKRERIDEYGWRHFGDIYADHEAIGSPPDSPMVSHYNNQYDSVGGFAAQFMRSGDARWWAAMEELARHVADIDIYHTREDKSAFNGGQFWHTYHYKDAGLSTHRAYPRAPGIEGGGPSNEQDYTTGLMVYHFLTGHVWAREAVLGLADWVVAVDDGSLTVFRWLSRSATGHVSSTNTTDYHGPGRGAAYSIVTLLNGYRLSSNRAYLDKAEALIRRCVHPDDDVAGRDLLDAERRWSYIVFLQALGRYLDDKATYGQLDCRYAYARASLLAYARWMADHEYPYLEKPAILEYPTETWAAQDMRKSEVFLHASRHATGDERTRFQERADFFYRASLDWLHRFDTRTTARPVVLMLSNGFMHATARRAGGLGAAPPPPERCDFGQPVVFMPQKQIAMRRAKLLVTAGGAMLLLLGLAALQLL